MQKVLAKNNSTEYSLYMETTIKVEIKNVYGKETIYPACPKAAIFADLVGQRTLTGQDIAKIKALGYTIEVVQKTKTL